jgi:hypothetical protein
MKKTKSILTATLLFFAAFTPAHAQLKGNCIDTAIGCVPVFGGAGTIDLMTFILGWGVGIAGGIAFLLMVYAGFQIMTSSGNPTKLQAGKELFGAAISGLLLLIFSAFIMRVVGVDILQIFT